MQIPKQFLAIFICLLLCAPSVIAQNTQSGTNISKEVTIMIERQQVRFTAQKAVEEMRLQVFDPAGELIYDSGSVIQPEINWPFQNGNGETVKSGLYAYMLSIKEPGQETAQVRRGHFIVDRAKDRDGVTDKLWVTSQNDNGVGTELTVARDENMTVAGASVPTREQREERGDVKRDNEGDEESKSENKNDKQTVEVASTGTIGKIAKFISATEVGNSALTEVEGKLGIGAAEPATKLDVRGHLTLDAGGSPVLYTGTATAEQNRFLNLINSPVYTSASGLKAGGILVSDSYAFADPGKNDLVVKGNVGIGTNASPLSKLMIEGQDALLIRGYEPFLNLQDANSSNNALHRIQSAHGDLNFFHGYLQFHGTGKLPSYVWTPRMVIKDTGNVGIGTIFPNHLLSLGRGPTWTRNGWGGAMELENGTAIAWKTNEAGNRFGIGHTNGGLYFFRTASDPGTAGSPADYDMSIRDTGVVSVRVLEITGGADFAENFEINASPESGQAAEKIEAGMVVSIDPANPGKLMLSTQPFDPQVAGIISGAGGIRPGMVMGQEGTLADGQYPVALTGRVYCWVDATDGAIKPGDLLTTSSTPGHAMKASNPAKARGAIIGKAMTGLKEGKGLVLVLVTLQ